MIKVLFVAENTWWCELVDFNDEWFDGLSYMHFRGCSYIAEFAENDLHSQLGSTILNKAVFGTLMFFKATHELQDILDIDINQIINNNELSELIQNFSQIDVGNINMNETIDQIDIFDMIDIGYDSH